MKNSTPNLDNANRKIDATEAREMMPNDGVILYLKSGMHGIQRVDGIDSQFRIHLPDANAGFGLTVHGHGGTTLHVFNR